jgi:hypothetical protein
MASARPSPRNLDYFPLGNESATASKAATTAAASAKNRYMSTLLWGYRALRPISRNLTPGQLGVNILLPGRFSEAILKSI